jgi:hypothetical protein
MKRLFSIFFLFFCFLGPPGWGWASTPTPVTPKSEPPVAVIDISDSAKELSVTRLEEEVSVLVEWLEKKQVERKSLQETIEKFQEKAATLRQEIQKNPNVLIEIRLKSLLNNLKEKLEQNSGLQHQWDSQQTEFEQKSLALVALYNAQIQKELETTDSATNPAQADSRLGDLTVLVKKRNRLQALLVIYQKKTENEKNLPAVPVGSIETHDKESLLLTLDLLHDRKKDLEGEMAKWSREEEEIRNDLKLQAKMQEFLEDIQKMNEDSDFPHGRLKRKDLEGIVGKNQKGKLSGRLNETHEKLSQGEKTLAQIAELMTRVQRKLDAFNERKRK